ncbi:MAG: GAF domain-containing protein [Anaerolineae bacterium]|nr:GAF domain-containing protein [Anaerolineae bacterium]
MLNTTQTSGPSVAEEIRHLSKMINDLEGLLRAHQQVIRQKAMNLPQGMVPSMQQLHTGLDQLATHIDETDTELRRLRALSDVTEIINSTLDLDDVLNAVMDMVIRLTGAERGYLMLRDETTREMEFRVARNIEQRSLAQDEFIISRTIIDRVAQSGEPVVTTNAAEDKQWKAQESVLSFALRSILCVPLILKNEVTGVIYADNRIRAGLFGPKELSLLYAFANQAAIAIENARLFTRLQEKLAEITAMKELMDNIFASIASGVITTDDRDTIMIINDAASRILNVDPQHSVGNSVWDVLPPLHESFQQLLQAVREQNLEETIETEPEIANRGTVNLNLKLSPLRDETKVTQGVAIVVDDLTELKRREAQLNVVRRYLPPAMVDNITSIDKLGLGGERHLVTTIFIDVRGFATFPPTLRPQELMQYLNVYLTIASDAVTQQNGVIDKYMANEIMGLFNTQLNPHDDHAWHAVVAALNMADQFNEYYAQSGEPAGTQYFRAGIHTGVATLGNAGSETRREFTAIGDSINLAHRLLENALPGQIIISEQTYQHIQDKITDPQYSSRVIPRGELLVKGKSQPTTIFQVCRDPITISQSS